MCTRRPEFQDDFLTNFCQTLLQRRKLLTASRAKKRTATHEEDHRGIVFTLHPDKLREEQESFHLGNLAICSVFYNYSLIYSFIQQMFTEHPFLYANILPMELFWVTGKEVVSANERENRFKIKFQRHG